MLSMNPKQYVELFHLLFLNQLGRKLDKKLYALKGGCNMRFYFNSIRYSENMDIDVQIISKSTLQNKVQQILNSLPFKLILQARKIEIISVTEPKQTETTQRWKITLKTPASTLPLHTKIEFSRRKLEEGVLFEAISPHVIRPYLLPPIMVNHYSHTMMYKQKVLALALRNQTQARDIFDIYLLINSGMNLEMSDKDLALHINQAIENAKRITFEDFKGHVLAYLSDEDQLQYDDKSVWENIISTVVECLDIFSNATA